MDEINGLNKTDVTSVDKLSFIGKRGMGALEFIPQSYEPSTDIPVELDELYILAKEIEKSREDISLNLSSNPGINDMMAVGMSAGGKHPKAIIAIDWTTNEVKSGQFSLPSNFEHYLLKFKDDEIWPTAEIEYVYYEMAQQCGIIMEECKLLNLRGENHFLTRRFDRKDGDKIHTATLQALFGEVYDYEDVFVACRKLGLDSCEIEQLYRRCVFNWLGYVCDDHDKNISFVMGQDGKWHLSPAYDVTFTVNIHNPFKGDRHAMHLYGMDHGITKDMLERFGKENDIHHPCEIIKEVCEALASFKEKIETLKVDPQITKIIDQYINK